jgi:chromate reductase, NAD(P)H dehydrogenase (quinone)
MITVINATNRKDNKTQVISRYYVSQLEQRGIEVKYFTLELLPSSILDDHYGNKPLELKRLIEEFIEPSKKFVIISPEYNGSFPGILKLLIDSVHPDYFKFKKAALVGVASGRAGNLRGLDHLTSILNHLQVEVMAQKSYVSSLMKLINEGEVTDEETKQTIEKQIDRFIKY